MGLFDLLTGNRRDVSMTRRALDEAEDPTGDDHAITRLIQQVLALGIEGRGPFASAVAVADKARARQGSTEAAIDAVVGTHLRGYDVHDPRIRTAVLLTLVGSNSANILAKAGISLGGGTLSQLATRSLPKAAAMVLEKAIGFRILRGVGERAFSRLGKAIPLAGGVIGAGIDWAMMRGIAEQARHEFPQVARG